MSSMDEGIDYLGSPDAGSGSVLPTAPSFLPSYRSLASKASTAKSKSRFGQDLSLQQQSSSAIAAAPSSIPSGHSPLASALSVTGKTFRGTKPGLPSQPSLSPDKAVQISSTESDAQPGSPGMLSVSPSGVPQQGHPGTAHSAAASQHLRGKKSVMRRQGHNAPLPGTCSAVQAAAAQHSASQHSAEEEAQQQAGDDATEAVFARLLSTSSRTAAAVAQAQVPTQDTFQSAPGDTAAHPSGAVAANDASGTTRSHKQRRSIFPTSSTDAQATDIVAAGKAGRLSAARARRVGGTLARPPSLVLERLHTHMRVAAEGAAAAWESGLALHRTRGFAVGAL